MIAQIALSVIFFISLLVFRFPKPASSLPPEEFSGYRSLGLAGPAVSDQAQLGDLGLEAKSVYILDLTENKTIYEKNALEVRPLASLTKLMTALLLEEKVPAGFYIPVSGEAIRQEGDDGFRAGEKFRKKDLIDVILVASSNDVSYAAAEFVGAGLEGGDGASVSRFVALMNERARELGLLKTSFLNASGLDAEVNFEKIPGASGTAFETARLLEFIFKNHTGLIERARSEEFEIVSEKGRRLKARNTNQALADIPQLIAAKTGFTDLAGGNLVFIFDAGFSRPVLVSILGSSEEGRFTDAKKIV
ncbi:MAG: hypothetical protein AAB730_01650, partial [Patescibacteria group bacterium]